VKTLRTIDDIDFNRHRSFGAQLYSDAASALPRSLSGLPPGD
jgi:hypothetical protein